MPRNEQEPPPLKERHLRHLRPEVTRELLPLATRLTGKSPLIKRMDDLPHEVNGLLVRPKLPNRPWEIHYRKDQERHVEHIISHEVGHIARLYQVPESERLALAVTQESRARVVETLALELAALLDRGFPEAALPAMFEEWLGSVGAQLYAFPADLRIEQFLHQKFPGLRATQQRALLAEVGRNEPLFSPAVRDLTPPTIYRATMAMNAAQAWEAAALFRRPDLLAPFQEHGLVGIGRHLTRLVMDVPDEGHRSDMAATNQWAEELGIAEWFEWKAYPEST